MSSKQEGERMFPYLQLWLISERITISALKPGGKGGGVVRKRSSPHFGGREKKGRNIPRKPKRRKKRTKSKSTHQKLKSSDLTRRKKKD